MNDREALKHIKATIGAFGPDEGIELDQKAWSKLHSAIKEALAQPEQEPVAWVAYENGEKHGIDFDEDEIANLPVGTMLYPAPPQREFIRLTDEEIEKTHETQVWDARRSYARAIEAKLKEKNK